MHQSQALIALSETDLHQLEDREYFVRSFYAPQFGGFYPLPFRWSLSNIQDYASETAESPEPLPEFSFFVAPMVKFALDEHQMTTKLQERNRFLEQNVEALADDFPYLDFTSNPHQVAFLYFDITMQMI